MDMSIIIPCYNLEKWITPLLVSLHLQVYNDKDEIEIIFICDSCTDNTKQIIQSYPWETTRYTLKLIETDVHSAGLARNIGMKHAEGKYIWFIDGDDWLINPYAINLIFNLIYQFPNDPIIRIKFLSSWKFPKKLHTHFSMVWQYIFKKDFIEDILFEDVAVSEDVLFMEKVIKKKKNNTYLGLNIPLYYYNFGRPNSTMTNEINRLQKEKNNETYHVTWSK